MKNKLCLITLIALLIIPLPSYGEENTLRLRADISEVLLGEEIILEIQASDLVDIAGADIEIIYDENKLEFKEKSILTDNSINIQDHGGGNKNLEDSNGSIRIIFGLNAEGDLLQGDQILAIIKFYTIDQGETILSLGTNSELIKEISGGGDLDYIYTNPHLSSLDLNIKKLANLLGNITSSDGHRVEGAVLTLTVDTGSETVITLGEDGVYAFNGLDDGNYTLEVVMPGYEAHMEEILIAHNEDKNIDIELIRIPVDVNRDGEVGLKDLVFVGSRFGLNSEDASWSMDADINGDGSIDILDLVKITRVIK